MANNYSAEDEAYFDKEQQAQQDLVIAQAVEAAARGENIEQLLELMLVSVSGKQKEAVRKKFMAALKKRGLRQPAGDADVPSHSALARLRNALTITAKQAYERVVTLVNSRPDVAAKIKQAGEILAKNGVAVERIQMSEAELGSISPNAAGVSQGRGDTGRGT